MSFTLAYYFIFPQYKTTCNSSDVTCFCPLANAVLTSWDDFLMLVNQVPSYSSSRFCSKVYLLWSLCIYMLHYLCSCMSMHFFPLTFISGAVVRVHSNLLQWIFSYLRVENRTCLFLFPSHYQNRRGITSEIHAWHLILITVCLLQWENIFVLGWRN